MLVWLIIFGSVYLAVLAYTSYVAKNQKFSDQGSFLLGGKDLGVFLGVLTYSATLFSTFTLMGMPDFFRIHGVGAWIFLGVTDVAMAYLVLTIGAKVHQVFRASNHYAVGPYLSESYQSKWASYIFLLGVFLFLIPYTAIQIKGISHFLSVAAPIKLPETYWSVAMLSVILTYSSVGGFKAIVYSDAIQGGILLLVVWLIAGNCLEHAGGVSELFTALKLKDETLLSVPGPKGLFTAQFLIASFIAIIVMPITQPQLTTRLIAMKNLKKLKIMAPSVAFFAIVIILPTVFLGMYGALHYGDLSDQDFWYKVLVEEQSGLLGALVFIGLIAASMSTTDSQLFALGAEASAFLNKENNQTKTKLLIFVFAIASLLFSIFSKGQLVILARLSFAGTALLAPMILLAIYKQKTQKLGKTIPIVTLVALIIFILSSMLDVLPKSVAGLRMDLILYTALTGLAVIEYFRTRKLA